MAKIGDAIKSDDWKTEKHVPVIELPERIQSGEPFTARVVVGKEVPHPNTSEHFIAWASLYYKPEGAGPVYHLGRADFLAHGASTKGANALTLHTDPAAAFQVKVDKPGELIAVIYCNIHGLWEGSAKLSL